MKHFGAQKCLGSMHKPKQKKLQFRNFSLQKRNEHFQNCTYQVRSNEKQKRLQRKFFFVIIKAKRNELFIFLGPKNKKNKKLKIAISLRRRIAHKGESISPRFYKFMQFSLFQTHSDSFAFSFNLQASPRQEGISRNRDTVRKKKRVRPKKKN